jgi:hypothetical protein
MKLLRLLAAAAFAAPAIAPVQAIADATSGSVIICQPTRGARCKDGQCKWREATTSDRKQLLELDFKLMDAVLVRGGKRKKLGKIIKVNSTDGKRDVVISRTGENDPKSNMVIMIVKGGKFTGWRANKRVRFEGMCKAA